MVKFKVAFTISAETMFGMLAKFLPVEDLQVEEIAPIPVQRPVQRPTITKEAPKKLSRPYKRRPSIPMDLERGINKIIIDALKDGRPRKAIELKPLIEAGGYSGNSVGSRLQNLEKHNIVIQIGDGTWRLAAALAEFRSDMKVGA